MKRIAVLTGAGMSAESGINTFRDADGLWEGHDVMQVASPQGWHQNQELVLDFYNQRRRQLFQVAPNKGHISLAELEKHFEIDIITQNVDNLHEKAGSTRVMHLHGELLKVRSTKDESLVYTWEEDLLTGDLCELGSQLRPHIVWFGEAVPMLEKAVQKVEKADILVIIGTSMQVYPAASLIHYVRGNTPIFFIDPKPTLSNQQYDNLTIIAEKAGTGVSKMIDLISLG